MVSNPIVRAVIGMATAILLGWLDKKRRNSINDTPNKFLYGAARSAVTDVAGGYVAFIGWLLAKADGRYVLGIILGAFMVVVSGSDALVDITVHRMLRRGSRRERSRHE